MGIFDIFSTKPAEEAAAARKRGLTQGFGEASKYLTQGADKAAGYYGQAGAGYDPAIERITRGYDAYSDAAGVNGPGGYDRARSNFQTGPGYQFAMDQGLEAAKRASGGVYSGGLLDELGPAGPEPEDLADLRRILYGLHAILRLHFAQEEEAYLSLLTEPGRAGTQERAAAG